MLVNLEKYLVLNQENFNLLIQHLNCNLSQSDNIYLITYLIANLLCYLAMFMTVKLAMFLYFQFFKKSRRVVRRWDI